MIRKSSRCLSSDCLFILKCHTTIPLHGQAPGYYQHRSTNNYQAGNPARQVHQSCQNNLVRKTLDICSYKYLIMSFFVHECHRSSHVVNMHISNILYTFLVCCFLMFRKTAARDPTRGSPPLKIDLIFPRNETYNPSPMFPIIFSYGNPEMIPLFEPIISYTVWNPSNYNKSIHTELRDKPFVNRSSSNPHIEFDYYSYPFNTEGTWELSVHLRWANCYVQSPRERDLDERVRMRRNFTTLGTVVFTTKGPLKQVDLADATNNETCSNPIGLSIDTAEWKFPIFDDAHDVDFVGSSCIVPQSPVEADRCADTLDPATISSIDATMTSWQCSWPGDEPDGVDCKTWRESLESTALRVIAGGATCLAFMLGVIAYTYTLM